MAGHTLLQLRPGTADDTALILAFIRELADYERLLGEVSADETGLRRSLFEQPTSARVLLAEVDGEAAGFALYHEMFSTFVGKPGVYLEDLFVRPALRGLGIGKALLLEVARQAHAGGACRLDWSVLRWNKSAIEFYESLGAFELEDWTRYRLDAAALARLVG